MSNQTYNRLQTAHRQNAFALKTNCSSFVSHYGIEHCGFLTLTFKDWFFPNAAKKKLTKALNVLAPHCLDYIWTTGLTGKNKRIHYHILLSCTEDLREGIDVGLYRHLLALDDVSMLTGRTVAEEGKEIRKRLQANASIQRIRRDIHPKLMKHGFGHQIILEPVLSTGEAIGSYMEKNYVDTIRRKDIFFQGIRLIGYRRGGHKILSPPFGFVGPGATRRRRRTERIANALGVTAYEDMKPTFGRKWGYLSNRIQHEMVQHHGSDPTRWNPKDIRHLAFDEGMMPQAA
jgi:hypothetical protein